jgi:hypothetical protein
MEIKDLIKKIRSKRVRRFGKKVKFKTMALKSKWTREMVEDLEISYYGDISAEIEKAFMEDFKKKLGDDDNISYI